MAARDNPKVKVKGKRGRPPGSKIARQNKFLEQYARRHRSVDAACNAAEVPWATYREWRRDPEFKAKLKEIDEQAKERLVGRLRETGAALALGEEVATPVKPDTTMLRHLQTAHDPDFKKESTVRVTGTITHEHHAKVLAGMSAADKTAELRKYLEQDELSKLGLGEAEEVEFEEVG